MADTQNPQGTPTLPPSLAELDAAAEEQKGAAPAAPPAIKNGEQGAPNLQEEAGKQAGEEKPADKVPGTEGEGEQKPGEEEGGEQPPADDAGAAMAADEFYAEVQKLSGVEVKVDYGETDPMSPEGVYMRDREIQRRAVKEFDEQLERDDPEAYAYFLHRKNGGTREEFFGTPTVALPDYETFKGNVDLHKRVIADDLRAKGVAQEIIDMVVDKAAKDGSLFTQADVIYKAKEAQEAQMLEDLKAENDRITQEYQTSVRNLEATVDDFIHKGKSDKLVIAEAKKAEFANFVKNNIRYDEGTGSFLVAQAFTPQNAALLMETLYFQFIGGDLNNLVAVKAKTENARRIGAFVTKDKNPPRNVHQGEKPGFIPLADL